MIIETVNVESDFSMVLDQLFSWSDPLFACPFGWARQHFNYYQ